MFTPKAAPCDFRNRRIDIARTETACSSAVRSELNVRKISSVRPRMKRFACPCQSRLCRDESWAEIGISLTKSLARHFPGRRRDGASRRRASAPCYWRRIVQRIEWCRLKSPRMRCTRLEIVRIDARKRLRKFCKTDFYAIVCRRRTAVGEHLIRTGTKRAVNVCDRWVTSTWPASFRTAPYSASAFAPREAVMACFKWRSASARAETLFKRVDDAVILGQTDGCSMRSPRRFALRLVHVPRSKACVGQGYRVHRLR